MTTPPNKSIKQAAELLKNSKYTTAFPGAGISVESGISPFRGDTGLWSKYDPIVLDISYFNTNPLESWTVIKEIFYDFFGKANPNGASIIEINPERSNFTNSITDIFIQEKATIAMKQLLFEI